MWVSRRSKDPETAILIKPRENVIHLLPFSQELFEYTQMT